MGVVGGNKRQEQSRSTLKIGGVGGTDTEEAATAAGGGGQQRSGGEGREQGSEAGYRMLSRRDAIGFLEGPNSFVYPLVC